MGDRVQLSPGSHPGAHARFFEVGLEGSPGSSGRLEIIDERLVLLLYLGVEVGEEHSVQSNLVRLICFWPFPHNPKCVHSQQKHLESLPKLGPVVLPQHRNSGENNGEG
ncbi:unnamed protein product [Mycena citricolor]|uniref:Uncharacterized protein n=1 Tax=Mycena citricolor TaxID=2018698 RepID=A0AAD2HP63_9AGAR|nr:unnamed protein product [Mycena citricolor]